MSQSGLLNEQEIAEQVHRYFDLKLDKEAYIKPTRDVVIEIYTRFLDSIGIDWRKPTDLGHDRHESSPKALILGWLRSILSCYSIDYQFHMGDLVQPSRKRTTIFLNVLVYIKAQLDEHWKYWQQLEAEQAEQQEVLDKLDQEIAAKRLELEELALRKGQSRSKDEIEASISTRKQAFEQKKKECDLWFEKHLEIKDAIKSMNEVRQQKLVEARDLDERIKLDNEMKNLKQENETLAQELDNVERKLESVKLQNSIKLMQAQKLLEQEVSAMRDFVQESRAINEKLKCELENIKRKRSDMKTCQKKRLDQVQECKERAKKKLDALVIRSECNKQETKKGEGILTNYKIRLESILGEKKTNAPNETMEVNRTYIRSTANGQ